MKSKLLVLFMFLGLLGATSPSYAASQDECAIWLCLPAGFPAGCSDAHSAFRKRIRKGRSPLPSFSSCAVEEEGGSKMTYDTSVSVLIPAETCGRPNSSFVVPSYTFPMVPGCVPRRAEWVENGQCPTIACQTRREITIYADGESIGTFSY